MKTYTEEDLRAAFREGYARGENNYRYSPQEEDEYIKGFKTEEVEEETVSFTYSFLRRKLEWEDFCDITGIDYYAKRNGYGIKDHEIFEIKESTAKQYGLL